jgi:hypothetical protein
MNIVWFRRNEVLEQRFRSIVNCRPSLIRLGDGRLKKLGPTDGPIVEMRLDCAGEALVARLTRRSVETLGLEPGRPVYAVFKSIAFDHHAFAGVLPPSPGADAETRQG